MRHETARVDGAGDVSRQFDVRAIRLATHGWLLGNPLVYKPGAADLDGIARQLARAGSASGTLVVGDDEREEIPARPQTILILRAPATEASPGQAAAAAIAGVARESLGCSCAIEGRWDVVTPIRGNAAAVAQVSMSEESGAVLLGLRFAFAALWEAGCDDDGQPRAPLLARADWREVFLARALHALDIHLRGQAPLSPLSPSSPLS